jgi:type VI secretion system secreted protein Hcp
MAFDSYMMFQTPDGNWLQGESQAKIDKSTETELGQDLTAGSIFEIDDFNFDIEQVLNIGSQSSGAGAGKVTFNPYNITRKTDRISAQLFQLCCAGQHFKMVSLFLRRAGGAAAGSGATMSSGTTFLRYDFALVAVKTISWSGSDGDEACKEEVAFEYGALRVRYIQQDASGKPMATKTGTWNRVYNNSNFEAIQTT